MEESVEYFPTETLRGLMPKNHVVLGDETVFPAGPLGLDIQVASQIREALGFHKERKKLRCFLLEARWR